MKQGAQVYRYMTPCPQTVGRDAPLAVAREQMSRFGIRHLPVLDDGDLVGILSDRELAMAERIGKDDPGLRVGDVMTPDPYIALPSTPLAEVADEMAHHRYGAAIIVDRGNVVGVFTAIDALRVLAEDSAARPRAATPRPTRPIG